jgi:hypothetical protein
MGVLQKSLSPLAPYPVPMLLPLYFLPASKLGKTFCDNKTINKGTRYDDTSDVYV